ncbi:hypothetical protein BS78_01G126700 [Paspalum vaginatum]|nr:hypothetical protein BS78_01G126700 [Paspalum vaginatum]
MQLPPRARPKPAPRCRGSLLACAPASVVSPSRAGAPCWRRLGLPERAPTGAASPALGSPASPRFLSPMSAAARGRSGVGRAEGKWRTWRKTSGEEAASLKVGPAAGKRLRPPRHRRPRSLALPRRGHRRAGLRGVGARSPNRGVATPPCRSLRCGLAARALARALGPGQRGAAAGGVGARAGGERSSSRALGPGQRGAAAGRVGARAGGERSSSGAAPMVRPRGS